MAQDNLIYPVGLFYVGPGTAAPNVVVSSATNSESNHQTTILPVQDEASANANASIISDNDAQVKDEDEVTGNIEDRNSESYWEKRKRFTLAFAAGLRKFIQLHPELLRYGPKKNQGGISATVTSSGAQDEILGAVSPCGNCAACQKTDDCGQCAFCQDMSKFGGKDELKKPCLQRQCVHAINSKSTSSISTHSGLIVTTNDSMEIIPARSTRFRGTINNDIDLAFPIKEELLDDDDDEEEIRDDRSRRTRVSPRVQRNRRAPRRSRNDDDEDYVPTSRRRRTKPSQAVENVLKGIRIKTEPVEEMPE